MFVNVQRYINVCVCVCVCVCVVCIRDGLQPGYTRYIIIMIYISSVLCMHTVFFVFYIL